MIAVALIGLLILVLAWANGANDVAKGVATLAGSGASSAKRAVIWGTLWTVFGGLTAAIWGGALVSTFSSGFLAPGFQADLGFIGSAMLGASIWLLAATCLGLPVSTTHALLGGVIGAALITAGPQGLRAAAVANKALLPLLVSPLIAIVFCWLLLLVARVIVRKVGPKTTFADANTSHIPPLANVGEQIWTGLHWLSSAATSFARGLNDVPKIAAFLTLMVALVPIWDSQSIPLGSALPFIAVALAMGLGSLWGGFRVLNVLAHRVAPLDASRGLAANFGTSIIVLTATPFGLPVSTTHVSTGSLMGIRWADRARPSHVDALKMILFGWVVTLPVASALAALSAWVFRAY